MQDVDFRSFFLLLTLKRIPPKTLSTHFGFQFQMAGLSCRQTSRGNSALRSLEHSPLIGANGEEWAVVAPSSSSRPPQLASYQTAHSQLFPQTQLRKLGRP